ncbi:MFS transporter [Lentzea tibetensis]|uniref:MFS transporter n=1 Tax=Lentzea tibetensis TaxID=2591470 RepID=UPI001644C3A9|nr:MFS transporter [Lentzea tibetensis]
MSTTDLTVDRVRSRVLRTVLVSQVLSSVGTTVAYTVTAVVAVSLAGSSTLVGIVLAITGFGPVVATALISRITDARGRRAGIATGYWTAAVGALVSVIAIVWHSYPVFIVGGLLVGFATVTNFQARFAATDLPSESGSAKSISLIVWVTTVGAVAGPNVSPLGAVVARWTGLPEWTGVFLIAAAGFAVAGAVVTAFMRPDPLLLSRLSTVEPGATVVRKGFWERVGAGASAVGASTRARYAIITTTVGHTVMISVMTWTPVHMEHGVSHVGLIGVVLSLHFAGMYAVSPVFGWVAGRVGSVPVMVGSTVVMGLSLVIGGTAAPGDAVRLAVALFLLGFGWCGMFVTGSALLSDSVPADARPAVQGLSDAVMWVGSAVAAAGAGWVVDVGGYPWLNACSGVLLVPCLVFGARVVAQRRISPAAPPVG